MANELKKDQIEVLADSMIATILDGDANAKETGVLQFNLSAEGLHYIIYYTKGDEGYWTMYKYERINFGE